MKAEIIAVGNEVVFGHTINTNAAFIARALEEVGGRVTRHYAVTDHEEEITSVLKESMERSELIFIIGGLGPTKDDLTKEVVCKVLGQPLICYEEVVDKMRDYFKRMQRSMPDNNLKQAYFPKECILLENNHGTAPGCILENGEQKIILLPGPPKELCPMMDQVSTYLKEKIGLVVYTKDIQLFGIGESHAAEQINHLLGEEEGLTVAPYVGNYEVVIRIKSVAKTIQDATERAEKRVEAIESCLGPYIIGYNGSKLEESVVALLKDNHYSVATAESCTGGMVASTLINCSGISSLLNESIVTYSNEAKMKYLGVKQESLDQFGAVSAQVAQEMADGIRKSSGADIGIATTGIAGPEGGTKEKPVGLVYVGIALPNHTHVYQLNLLGTRQQIREKATKNLLYQLYKNLQ